MNHKLHRKLTGFLIEKLIEFNIPVFYNSLDQQKIITQHAYKNNNAIFSFKLFLPTGN